MSSATDSCKFLRNMVEKKEKRIHLTSCIPLCQRGSQRGLGNFCLAIETSGRKFSIALGESSASGFVLKGELFLDVGLRHSEILKDACVWLLEKCVWTKEDLTFLSVSTGPGSFTGLRVGISFARAMAQGLNIPLIGVPTFEVIAAGLSHSSSSLSRGCVLIDSIGDEVFAGFFEPGEIRPSEPYAILKVPELLKKVRRNAKTIFAGEGFLHYESEIRKHLGRRIVDVSYDQHFPQARYLAERAFLKIKRSRPSKNSWRKVAPFYLRLPMAVERLKQVKK